MSQTYTMQQLGLTDRFAVYAAQHDSYHPGRVFSQGKDLYRVVTEGGELFAEVSGKFRFESHSPADFPAVGDFVLLDRSTGADGNAVIHGILPRKSAFIRKAAGTAGGEQVVAANIDTVFICMALNNDFSLRRLERYLSIAWDSGATPVVVLTKSDLASDANAQLREVESVAIGADVLLTSSLVEGGYAQVLPYLGEGRTVAFIGSSGVGKSTLINRLLGDDVLDTQGLRGDDKGRHTTTARELIVLPSGGMVIDTPGMRELGIESADLSKAFADIDNLAAQCRFGDCTHEREPGCAVRAAIDAGELDEDRLESYRKLSKEAKYDGMNARQIENAKIEGMFGGINAMKAFRKHVKKKNGAP